MTARRVQTPTPLWWLMSALATQASLKTAPLAYHVIQIVRHVMKLKTTIVRPVLTPTPFSLQEAVRAMRVSSIMEHSAVPATQTVRSARAQLTTTAQGVQTPTLP